MNAITLHAAVEEVRAILDSIDPETGEIEGDLNTAREVVARKAVAVTAYILETLKQSDYLRAYAKELGLRAATMDKRAEWLRTYLSSHMAAAGITKVADERSLFSAQLMLGRDKSVDVFDAAQLPADYLREIPARQEPDKQLIAKAIKDGFEVPGARIVARDRLVIR